MSHFTTLKELLELQKQKERKDTERKLAGKRSVPKRIEPSVRPQRNPRKNE